ncbi:MAG: hypothetical protein QXY79_03315 [Candidatus Methanomethylicia archaeon]
MTLNEYLDKLVKQQKEMQLTIKLLRNVSKLVPVMEQKEVDELYKVKTKLSKIDENIEKLIKNIEEMKQMPKMSEYQKVIDNIWNKKISKFGVMLEERLKMLGISLSGHYPTLSASIFTIELNFDEINAKIWYGPKQELLGKLPLSIDKIITFIENERKKIGSQFSSEEFSGYLQKAYERVVGPKWGEPAQIIKVLVELSFLIQKPRFLIDPKRENYKSYSRADFSYDLYKLRLLPSSNPLVIKPHLVVSTRENTKNRDSFLWIPDDENGKGTCFSHIIYGEEYAKARN